VENALASDESRWRDCFAAAREQAPSEWSDLAVEIMTVLVMAGSESDADTERDAREALEWFLGHRVDVLHEAMRWAGLDIVTFRPSAKLKRYSNERALITLRQVRTRLGR